MLVSVGHENTVDASKVVAIARPESAPIKRAVGAARKNGLLIDLCNGKACRSVLFTDAGRVILSSVRPRALRDRLNRETVVKQPRNSGEFYERDDCILTEVRVRNADVGHK